VKPLYLSILFAFLSYSCGDSDSRGGAGVTGYAGAYSVTGGYSNTETGWDSQFPSDWDSEWDEDTASDEICQDLGEVAKLDEVYMAFAFDVSGSMGKGDKCYHDKELKWDPVTQAASAFLEETASTGLWASMTFFPAMDIKCEDLTYYIPDVPFTRLPSTAFRDAFEYIIATEGFRGRTPTLHVLNGVLYYVRQTREESPGKYVIVLVTDGMPEHCSDNSVSSVVEVVAAAAAEDLPTYVIGINNPPCGPETLDDLNEIAVGGGTEKAFLIDTGDPEKTANDFNEVVESIREFAVACTIIIPEMPPGKTFDRRKVQVVSKLGTTVTELVYDGDCQGPNTWRYDNPDQPKKIVLCEETCDTVKADPATTLEIVFLCAPVIII